LKDQMNTN